ncbi:hypothetical protein C8J57DRAFT_1213238 [Mycena rebaudengoi]|nr:hypothetical protein C8J57DRAFT_1213238 [Mycena rebaudengoi]
MQDKERKKQRSRAPLARIPPRRAVSRRARAITAVEWHPRGGFPRSDGRGCKKRATERKNRKGSKAHSRDGEGNTRHAGGWDCRVLSSVEGSTIGERRVHKERYRTNEEKKREKERHTSVYNTACAGACPRRVRGGWMRNETEVRRIDILEGLRAPDVHRAGGKRTEKRNAILASSDGILRRQWLGCRTTGGKSGGRRAEEGEVDGTCIGKEDELQWGVKTGWVGMGSWRGWRKGGGKAERRRGWKMGPKEDWWEKSFAREGREREDECSREYETGLRGARWKEAKGRRREGKDMREWEEGGEKDETHEDRKDSNVGGKEREEDGTRRGKWGSGGTEQRRGKQYEA